MTRIPDLGGAHCEWQTDVALPDHDDVGSPLLESLDNWATLIV